MLLSIYKLTAIEVLPQCELLRIGLADLEESRSNIKAAKQAWKVRMPYLQTNRTDHNSLQLDLSTSPKYMFI
jgi:hypothetical protein